MTKVNTYHFDVVNSGIQEVLHGLGGLEKYINPGERVLLKPNLVEGMPPEKAVNTHPWVVREVLFFRQTRCFTYLSAPFPNLGKRKRGQQTFTSVDLNVCLHFHPRVAAVGQLRH